jgi:o-succinylbenzoate---CoA ligase
VPRLLTPIALDDLPVGTAGDRLQHALDGVGDVLLPVRGDRDTAARLDPLQPGTPLLDGEDDDADPTALVVATSGSTGEPKGVLLPASALRASAAATHHRLGGPGTWLLALPPHHIAGVQVLVRSLLADTRPEVLALGGGFDPGAFADATARLDRRAPGRCYTALVPTQLVRILDAGTRGLEALRRYDAVLLGGAAAAPALLRRARDAGITVVTTYGMTETCGGCVYDRVPLDGVHVDIDDSSRPAGDHPGDGTGSGRIRLGGPVVARGYRLHASSGQFSQRDGVRWFTTTDIGSLDRSGHLTVLGRADDVIVTGGVNVAPQAVEAVINELVPVAECLVVGVPDEEWGQRVVALVLAQGAPAQRPLELDVVRHLVKSRLGAAAAPHDVLLVDALPTTTLGKPDRRAAATLAAGRLAPTARQESARPSPSSTP